MLVVGPYWRLHVSSLAEVGPLVRWHGIIAPFWTEPGGAGGGAWHDGAILGRATLGWWGAGYYGVSDNETFSEKSSSGSDFLSEVCREWEAVADTAQVAPPWSTCPHATVRVIFIAAFCLQTSERVYHLCVVFCECDLLHRQSNF